MSGSCRIADIVHSGHAHSITGPSSGWLILSGTFFFCRNRHPLMRDDAFLLHVLCLPLSPAQACIGEVPSSASCIGRPSSALHIRLLHLKLSHKKRDDIDTVILPFSPKMPYKRNLGVLRNAAVFSLFSFFRMRIAPFSPPFSFFLFFLLSPFLRVPSFMRGAFSFFPFVTEEKKEG